MIAALGDILLGVLIGSGVVVAWRTHKAWQLEDSEEDLRNASWASIAETVALEEIFQDLPDHFELRPGRGK